MLKGVCYSEVVTSAFEAALVAGSYLQRPQAVLLLAGLGIEGRSPKRSGQTQAQAQHERASFHGNSRLHRGLSHAARSPACPGPELH